MYSHSLYKVHQCTDLILILNLITNTRFTLVHLEAVHTALQSLLEHSISVGGIVPTLSQCEVSFIT